MESPYQTRWRLQDVITAIQVMGSSSWYVKSFENWSESLGVPRSSETWEAVLKEHPEFFTVRIAPWISGRSLKFPLLITRLRDAQDEATRALRGLLSEATQEQIKRYPSLSVKELDDLKAALAKELNALLRKNSGGKQLFKDLDLPPQTETQLKGLNPRDARMIRNRLALEAEFHDEITPESLEPLASLTWRAVYDKNYDAEEWKTLSAEEIAKRAFEERDRLSRRPLQAEQIQALITTALEMHTHALAEQHGFIELREEVRKNQEEARDQRSHQLQEVRSLAQEIRDQRQEARVDKQERRWWIPLATAGLAFLGGIMGALFGVAGVIVAALLKGKSP